MIYLYSIIIINNYYKNRLTLFWVYSFSLIYYLNGNQNLNTVAIDKNVVHNENEKKNTKVAQIDEPDVIVSHI